MEAVVGAAMRAHVFDGRFKTDRGMGGEMPEQVIVHIDSAQLSFCQLLASDALGGRKVVHVSRPADAPPLARCVHVRVRAALSFAACAPPLLPCCRRQEDQLVRALWVGLRCSVVLRGIRGGCSP